MTKFLEIIFFSRLDEILKNKKGPTTKQNLNKKRKKHKTYLPLAFLPLLSIDAGVAIVTIFFLCSKK
jgi:hypothetical protein